MLNKLKQVNTKKSKTVGRGIGSGKGGHTVGKGSKGHKSRSGYKSSRPGFEGGQMPLSRRIPKLKGFSRSYHKIQESIETITTEMLNVIEDKAVVTIELLKANHLISKSAKQAKVVFKGMITKALTLEGIKVSKGAQSQIEKSGGIVK